MPFPFLVVLATVLEIFLATGRVFPCGRRACPCPGGRACPMMAPTMKQW
eukprot:CAMPEP_0167779586 /NCGR_PEP_ID=MMETSP0111_2-20121227/4885_1 /TAXON_ID=91324 /ORGANISM="Lotharella globosa, Strain CCCM811" /LENGTH=48 /DNA_ID= /DNA_START= /DNA_END= /DNA_ORIENTATION=